MENEKTMRGTLLAVFVAGLVTAPTLTLAQGANDVAPGRNKEALQSLYGGTGSPTPGGAVSNLGGAISGGFYGNTSNAGIDADAPERGHGVTPSISPGPQTVGGDGPGSGTSIGEAIQSLR
jgi:hypothetical protein